MLSFTSSPNPINLHCDEKHTESYCNEDKNTNKIAREKYKVHFLLICSLFFLDSAFTASSLRG
jgi:hypothetical protein